MYNIKNTEDKQAYCKLGLWFEIDFVDWFAPAFGLDAIINPEKIKNPYAADLIVNNNLADLKYQGTPFFLSKKLYNIDPQYACTLNKKDVVRYNRLYPDIHIYFWIQRKPQFKFGTKIVEMEGVWAASLKRINILIARGIIPLHSYQRRKNDTIGNAKDSYVLDVRWLTLIGYSFPPPKSSSLTSSGKDFT